MANIVTVNGLDIKENSLYKIVDKPDNNALDGLKQYGSTKIPLDHMSNIVSCPYDSRTQSYDTGFYFHSPCYRDVPETEKAIILENVNSKIVEPYETIYGKGILDNRNEDFWNDYLVELEEGKIFNTANVKELLELYIAMRGFELTPKHLKGDPRFKDSQFMVEDREVTVSKKNERDQNYMDSLQSFFTLMATEKHKLIAILKYARMNGADGFDLKTPDSNINSLFKNWIDNDVVNVDNFLRAAKMANRKAGIEEITLFSLLLDLNRQGKLVKVGEEFTYNDTPLGPDFKTAAKNLALKKSLAETKATILKEETTD